MNVFISIDYDEQSQDSYNGFVVSCDDQKKIFFTGNPEQDHQSAVRYIRKNYPHHVVLETSSLTHFVFDGDRYYFDDKGMLRNH